MAVGKRITVEEEVSNVSIQTEKTSEYFPNPTITFQKDPFNAKCGGMVNMKALKSGKIKTVDDAYDTGIGTQFSAETNKRDEDEEMMK